MSYSYPAQPLGNPCTPAEDGVANVEIAEAGYVMLTLPDGSTSRIPFSAIERDGIVVAPGDENGPNRVILSILAGAIECTGDPSWIESVPPRRKRGPRA